LAGTPEWSDIAAGAAYTPLSGENFNAAMARRRVFDRRRLLAEAAARLIVPLLNYADGAVDDLWPEEARQVAADQARELEAALARGDRVPCGKDRARDLRVLGRTTSRLSMMVWTEPQVHAAASIGAELALQQARHEQQQETADWNRARRRLGDRPRLSIGFVQGVVADIGVGLQDAGIAGQVSVRMLGRPVARVAEHRGWWRRPTKGPVVTDIGPDPTGDGLAPGQHGDGGVVAVQARGGEDMGVDQGHQRRQVGGAGADPVGDGRDAELDTLQGIGLALAVQRLVLAELGLENHGQQVRPRPAAGNGVEWRRRLGDGLAESAGEPFADGLDDLPLDWLDLEHFGRILAQLRQLAATAGAGGRARDDHPLARQVGRQGCPHRLATGRLVRALAASVLGSILGLGGVLAGGGDQLAELKFQLVEQLAAALQGGAVLVVLEPGDQQLEVRHHRLGAGGARLGLAPCQLLGRECGAQRGDVVGRWIRGGHHADGRARRRGCARRHHRHDHHLA
jgi:hypothetical protein